MGTPSGSLKAGTAKKLWKQTSKLEEFESRAQCLITSAALLPNSDFAILTSPF